MVTARGFTLLECITALTIAGTLVTVGMPAMQHFLVEQRLTAAANDTLGVLLQARAGGQMAGTILVCVKGSNCQNPGSGQGLFAFQDQNHNYQHDAGEPIIAQTHDAGAVSWQWKSFQNKTWLRYQPGGLSYYQNGSFVLCLEGSSRRVIVNWAGKPRIGKPQPGTQNCST